MTTKHQEQLLEKFDKEFPHLSVVEGVYADGGLKGYDPKDEIKKFLLTSVAEAEKAFATETINKNIKDGILDRNGVVKDLLELSDLKQTKGEESK